MATQLAPTAPTPLAFTWDESPMNALPAGWLWAPTQRPGHEPALGIYLDYAPDAHRSGHSDRCSIWHRCADCQPGNVLAVLPERGALRRESRWFPTIADAKAWIEHTRPVCERCGQPIVGPVFHPHGARSCETCC